MFRDRERGDLHLPEFTMLEWYRANAAYDAVMADSVAVIAHAAQATGIGQFSFRGRHADPFAEPELLTVAAAFERFAGIDLLATVADGEGDRAAWLRRRRARVRIADDDTWSDIFSKVLVEHVEPHLGQGRLTVLFEYPAPEAALARVKPSDPRVAERFEVYACGVELANGFGELTDAAEQRHRFAQAMDEKQRRYGERYPLDEDFLAAVAANAGGKRRRARLRPAGDAGERRVEDRSGGVDAAGRRSMRQDRAGAPSTLRQPAELVAHGLAPAAELADLEKVAARYAVAVTPDIAALIDPEDPDDPIARQFIPSAEELVAQPGESADPIGDHAHSPVAGIVHRYPDRVLFKLVHVCAVYCRFCFRREMVGPGKATALSQAAYRERARLYPRASGDLGSDPDRRRSPDAVAAAAGRDHGRPRRDRSRQDHPPSYPRAGGRSRARQRRDGRGAEGRGRHDLGCAARQSSARIDRGGARRPAPASSMPAFPWSASRCCCAASMTMPRRWKR